MIHVAKVCFTGARMKPLTPSLLKRRQGLRVRTRGIASRHDRPVEPCLSAISTDQWSPARALPISRRGPGASPTSSKRPATREAGGGANAERDRASRWRARSIDRQRIVVRSCVDVCMLAYVWTYRCLYMRRCVHAFTCLCACIHLHVYMSITHTHTHTHVYRPTCLSRYLTCSCMQADRQTCRQAVMNACMSVRSGVLGSQGGVVCSRSCSKPSSKQGLSGQKHCQCILRLSSEAPSGLNECSVFIVDASWGST